MSSSRPAPALTASGASAARPISARGAIGRRRRLTACTAVPGAHARRGRSVVDDRLTRRHDARSRRSSPGTARGWPQACGSHRRQVRSAARRESIRRASSVAQMRSSAARSSASSASTSARRIDEPRGRDLPRERPPRVGERHVHGAPVGRPAGTRDMPVGLELVDEPYDARVAEPQAPGEPVDRAPRREGGQRRDRGRPPTGSRGGRRGGGFHVARERVDHRPQHVRRVLRRGMYARSIYMPATPVAMA